MTVDAKRVMVHLITQMKRTYRRGTFGLGLLDPRRIVWQIDNDKLEAALRTAIEKAAAEDAAAIPANAHPVGRTPRPHADRRPHVEPAVDDDTLAVVQALTNLGYSAAQSRVAACRTEGEVGERIRQALQSFGSGRAAS